MNPICASLLAIHCLSAAPAGDEPLGMSHSVAGRFGVAYEQVNGVGRTHPIAQLAYTVTWRHEFDSGARVAVSVGVEGDTLRRDPLAWR